MIYYHIVPPGTLLLEECNGILTRCIFIKEAPGESYIDVRPVGVIAEAIKQIDEYFAGRLYAFQLPLREANTEFGTRIRQALMKVPYGRTISYSDLARMVGCEKGARAVGNALAHNLFHIIIPCHRVLPSNGSLGGYAGGQAVKKFLLEHESSDNQN